MPTEGWDVIIRNATVYDGTGSPSRAVDVALVGERIAVVGQIEGRALLEIDASGLALAPGFVDAHTHDDFAVLLDPEMDFKIMQGVTTCVVGNCGFGPSPFQPAARFFGPFQPCYDLPRWDGFAGYMAAIDHDPPSVNVAVLAGHGCIRAAVMGETQTRAPSTLEMSRMRALLEEALAAGVVGLSTGLIYEPGRHAGAGEIAALARDVAAAGGIHTTHLRNEAGALAEAVQEALHVGESAGVPVQISHHKASGKDNWGRVRDSLALIEQARAQGLDVTADQYPYTAGSTVLQAVLEHDALNERGVHGGLGRVEGPDVLIASAPGHPEYDGHTIAALAERFGLPAEAGAKRILQEVGAGVVVVVSTMAEEDVRTVLRHPTTMIGSDGVPAAVGNPHPRLYGTFPRVLGRYVRELGLLALPEAVHKMTGLPAAKFQLHDRGVIRPGAFADLVLFDPASVIDRGTYETPRQYPEGIHQVFVNGRRVVRDGRHTGARFGRALRRNGP